jgi:hypothetical protein
LIKKGRSLGLKGAPFLFVRINWLKRKRSGYRYCSKESAVVTIKIRLFISFAGSGRNIGSVLESPFSAGVTDASGNETIRLCYEMDIFKFK